MLAGGEAGLPADHLQDDGPQVGARLVRPQRLAGGGRRGAQATRERDAEHSEGERAQAHRRQS